MPVSVFDRPHERNIATQPALAVPSSAWELFSAAEESAKFSLITTSRRYAQTHAIHRLDLDNRFLKLFNENFPVIEEDIPKAFERARAVDPGFPEYEDYLAFRNEVALGAQRKAAKAQQFTTTDWPTMMALLGGGLAMFRDPALWATALVSPTGVKAALGLGAAMEVPIQGTVYKWHKDIGSEYTPADVLMGVGLAGAVPASIVGASKAGSAFLSSSSNYVRNHIRMGSNATPYTVEPPPGFVGPVRPQATTPTQGTLIPEEGPTPGRGQTFEEASGPEAEPIIPEPPPREGPTFEEASGPEAEPIIPEPPPKEGEAPKEAPSAENPFVDEPEEMLRYSEKVLKERLEKGANEEAGDAINWAEQDVTELADIEAVLYKGKPFRRETVRVPNTDMEFDTRFEVVELKDLITSDMKGFDQALQPRDRTLIESERQIRKILDEFDPRLLLSDPSADRGAPIIGYTNNMVESGNGRVMALRRLSPEQKAAYREAVAKFLGYEPEGDMPILVRRRDTPLSEAEKVLYTQSANTSTSARLDPQAELEVMDIKPDILKFYKRGEVTSPANAKFVSEWLDRTGNNLGTFSKKGNLTPIGEAQIELWLMKQAYGGRMGGDELIASLEKAGRSAPAVQGLLSMLRNLAGEVGALRHHVKGTNLERLDISEDLVAAAVTSTTIRKSKDAKAALAQFLRTEDMIGVSPEVKILVEALSSTNKTEMENLIKSYIRRANDEITQGGSRTLLDDVVEKEAILRGITDDFKRSLARLGREEIEGEPVGGLFKGDGEDGAGRPADEPLRKPEGDVGTANAHASISARVMEFVETGTGPSPFREDLSKTIPYLEQADQMVKEMEGREGAVVVLEDDVYTPSTIATQEEAAQVMPTANGASEIKEADDVLNAFSTCAKKP